MTATPGAVLDRAPDTREQLGHGDVTHIVRRDPGDERPAAAVVLEARVEGLPLTALCGHVWVPTKDPKRLPLCSRCEQLFGEDQRFPDGFHPQSLPS